MMKDALRKAEAATSKVGTTAATVLTEMGTGRLIVIRKIEFDVPIAMAAAGKFPGTVKASVLGNDYHTFAITIDLESVEVMVDGLAEKVFPGITAIGQ